MNRALKIGVLEGDDIGLEVVPEAVKVMRAAAQKTGLANKHGEPKAVRAAEVIEHAMEQVIRGGKTLTPDLGGRASTIEMGDAVVAEVAKSTL